MLPTLDKIKEHILNPFISFLMVLAFVYFVYGLVIFIANFDNETKRSAGKLHMIWGVIGLVIMVSVYGLLDVVRDTISSML